MKEKTYGKQDAEFLHLFRRADTLIDMKAVESITICGVEIPLR